MSSCKLKSCKEQPIIVLNAATSCLNAGKQVHGNLGQITNQPKEIEKLNYVHSASLAYEDGSVFMSGPFAEWL